MKNNLLGLSSKEEDKKMFIRMKKEEVQDKAKEFLGRMEKLDRQKALREYLNQQLKEKSDIKNIEKVKNDYFHKQVINDKTDFENNQIQKKVSK